MKKLFATIIATAFLASLVTSALAAEQTIKGEAVCTKCTLHQSDECQTAIRTKMHGIETIYYTVDNDVARNFHKNICKAPAKVVATGTIEEKDGKKMITLTKIDLVTPDAK